MGKKYDAIVIGTGQAGPSLAQRLTQQNLKTAIIERHLFGGTCVNVGCIPTKTLVASARAAYLSRRGQEFGVMINGPITIDMKRVKARKDAVVRQSREGVANWLKNMPRLTVYEGHGRFEGPHSIRVNDDLLEADKIFINVGARAAIPDLPGLDGGGFPARASCHRRWQLYWSGIRPDVPALR
jgi:pyruvate/2-oxoglutarate dehydrogenase complex dihydrolipoamide dehydrogenase (E3) component